MKLFKLFVLNVLFAGSFYELHCAHAVFLNPTTYIGKNVEIAGARVNIWQVMQGMEALALLFNVQEKDINPRISRLPAPAKNIIERVLKVLIKKHPKSSSLCTHEDKIFDAVEHNGEGTIVDSDRSMLDRMQTYLDNPHASIRNAKDHMQSHWFIWMMLSILAQGLSANNTYEGARSSIAVGGINLIENVAVETIGDYGNFCNQGRRTLQGVLKLGSLALSVGAQWAYSRSQDNAPELVPMPPDNIPENPQGVVQNGLPAQEQLAVICHRCRRAVDAPLLPSVFVQNPDDAPAFLHPSSSVSPQLPPRPSSHLIPSPPIPPALPAISSQLPPPPPPAPSLPPVSVQNSGPKQKKALFDQIQTGTTLKHVEEADLQRKPIRQSKRLSDDALQNAKEKLKVAPAEQPKPQSYLPGRPTPDALQEQIEKMKNAPKKEPVSGLAAQEPAGEISLAGALSNAIQKRRQNMAEDDDSTKKSFIAGVWDSWFGDDADK